METAGYSGTPLARKLGLKSGFQVLLINKPDHYFSLFQDFPEDIHVVKRPSGQSVDFIHVFCKDLNTMHREVPPCISYLKKSGIVWISWPKGSSDLASDLNREGVRDFLLELGLVDIKVCAVDRDWSGLKFMYRKKDR